jgi:3-hydroxybutyryl-CoA dehydrogenase
MQENPAGNESVIDCVFQERKKVSGDNPAIGGSDQCRGKNSIRTERRSLMKTVMVIGAGFMGTGIAQVCIQNGYRVILSDVEDAALRKAETALEWSLKKLHQKGWIKEPVDAVRKRLETMHGLKPTKEVSWVIEAVYEEEALKKKIFAEVEDAVGKDALFATNTSSIPITRLAASLDQPDRLVGLHFFGPVPFMGLVEVVRSAFTSGPVFREGVRFAESLGKHAVCVEKDIPGFVMNRVFAAAFRECQELVADGVATPEDIDVGMRLGYGWNIGPFEIADNAGLDTFLRVGQSMKSLGQNHLYSDSGLIENMVADGKLGRKSGEGFYRYDPESGKKLTKPIGDGQKQRSNDA